MSTLPRRALAATSLASLLSVLGCEVQPAHIELTPHPLTLKVDDELDLHVQVLDDDRQPLKRFTPKLTIEGDPVVKMQSTTLSLVGLSPGQATLVVQAGALKQRFPVRVLAPRTARASADDDEIEDVFDLAPEPAAPSGHATASAPDYDELPGTEGQPPPPYDDDDDDGAGTADDTE